MVWFERRVLNWLEQSLEFWFMRSRQQQQQKMGKNPKNSGVDTLCVRSCAETFIRGIVCRPTKWPTKSIILARHRMCGDAHLFWTKNKSIFHRIGRSDRLRLRVSSTHLRNYPGDKQAKKWNQPSDIFGYEIQSLVFTAQINKAPHVWADIMCCAYFPRVFFIAPRCFVDVLHVLWLDVRYIWIRAFKTLVITSRAASTKNLSIQSFIG